MEEAFNIKGKPGAKRIFETPEELQEQIDSYFAECDKNVILVTERAKVTEPYTVEGLSLVLGCDRDTLLNYQKKKGYEEFHDIVERAKMRIQRQKVVRGLTGLSNPSVTIFDLKNNSGYSDKQEHDHTTNGESINKVTPIVLADGRNIEDVINEIKDE